MLRQRSRRRLNGIDMEKESKSSGQRVRSRKVGALTAYDVWHHVQVDGSDEQSERWNHDEVVGQDDDSKQIGRHQNDMCRQFRTEKTYYPHTHCCSFVVASWVETWWMNQFF